MEEDIMELPEVCPDVDDVVVVVVDSPCPRTPDTIPPILVKVPLDPDVEPEDVPVVPLDVPVEPPKPESPPRLPDEPERLEVSPPKPDVPEPN